MVFIFALDYFVLRPRTCRPVSIVGFIDRDAVSLAYAYEKYLSRWSGSEGT